MSQWKFGDFETEIDFTDADFLERLEEAQEQLDQEGKEVPKVGKNSEIIRKQVACFARFFDTLFGDGTSQLMYGGRASLENAMRSCEEFANLGVREDKRIDSIYGKYKVNPNRQQSRPQHKNHSQYSR